MRSSLVCPDLLDTTLPWAGVVWGHRGLKARGSAPDQATDAGAGAVPIEATQTSTFSNQAQLWTAK